MSVTAAEGFEASGVAAGIRPSGRPDVAVVRSVPPAVGAALWTTNRVQAAPVTVSKRHLALASPQAVLINAGVANAATGAQGEEDAVASAVGLAGALDLEPEQVLVLSTGVIGPRLPLDKVLAGARAAAGELSAEGGDAAAAAIMTTDSGPKVAVAHAAGFTVGGMAKGAGMIHPRLATMLVVLTTDAVADTAACDAALRSAVGKTFDRLDIDGGTSTNDTVLLLASGASGVTPSAAELTAAVHAACTDLCLQLQADAEGVTKHVTVAVRGARSEADAVAVARTVAQDNLCKTAFFAGDPNWGRIAMAVGRAPGEVDAQRLGITINGVALCRDGVAVGDRHAADMSGRDITIAIELGLGEGAAEVLTTDLSHAYVEENSAYSS